MDRPTHTVATTTGPRWTMIGAGAALVGTCYGLARFAYGLFLPEFSKEFAIGSAISGLIGAGSYVGYCLAIVASLLLTPRWGPRTVAVLAGLVATAGLSIVAASTSAPMLAVGILIAGSSTGIASPPLAAAVDAWVRSDVRDRGQTIINAGTGLGVLVSGPVAMILLDQWRPAWVGFAVVAALVTCWAYRVVPAGPADSDATNKDGAAHSQEESTGRLQLAPGTWRLLAGSFVMGLGSIAIWGFGRDLLTTQADVSTLGAAIVWTILGAAGILGAFGGDVVRRVGLGAAWVALMLAMGAATALFALAPGTYAVVFTASAMFGASYIGLTSVVLLWSTRLYPARPSFGVGLPFFTIAAGQAVGSPLVGQLIGTSSVTFVFYAWAGLGLLGAIAGPASASALRKEVMTGEPNRSV